jgi:hypothetical protein
MMSFSDYMIYGVSLREIAGHDEADHARSTVPFVKPSQGISLSTVSAIETFFRDFDARTVAVMIRSRDGIDVSPVPTLGANRNVRQVKRSLTPCGA